MRSVSLAALASMTVLSPCLAQSNQSEEWEYLLVFPMIWTPSITGTSGSSDGIVNIDIPFDNIVSNLNFGLMGDFYAQQGKWLLGVRANYLHIKSSNSSTYKPKLPLLPDITTTIDLDATMSLNDLFAGYEVTHGLVMLTGVRHTYSKFNIDIGVNEYDIPSINSSGHQFDWLVGLKYAHWFNQNWGLSLTVDTSIAGDNDVNRGLNLAGMYRLSKLNNIWFGYRYLNIQNDSGTTQIDVTQQGPMIGWAFSF
ncbi:hypothetical protein [Vibrio mediterranei]|uniref:hypothetical protein n=1 Tax=Vibrio mediterranei TaxID=689 RepID=UPI0020A2C245|nr:hypothetical protein [Vibrio mediterranei]